MACKVVNSQAQLQGRLPALPAKLPASQAEWTAFVQKLQRWGAQLQQANHPPNVIPSQFQTFTTVSASAVIAALSALSCTPSIDAAQQFYGGASLKVAISASGAHLAFTGFPISIAAASRWFCAFQILAPNGCAGSLSVITKGGTTLTESFTVDPSGDWQQVWGLIDLRRVADTAAAWQFTFVSTETVWIDGMQMNAIGDPIGMLPKFSGTQMVTGPLAYAADLDAVPDGAVYERMPAANMDATRRALIDLSQAGHLNRNTDFLPPGTGNGATTLAVIGHQRNLVPDSGFKSALGQYWIKNGEMSITQNLDGITNCLEYIGTGAPSAFQHIDSAIIPVSPGLYTLSAVVGGSAITVGSAFIGVYSTDIVTAYGTLQVTPSDNGRISTVLSIPAGVSQVRVIFDTDNCTVASGRGLYCQQIQLEAGSVMTAYQETVGDQLAGSLLVDFANAGHSNKVLDSIGDGVSYARPLASRLSSGRPWIDFSEGIHANKSLEFIADGPARFAAAQAGAIGDGFQIIANPDFAGGSLSGYSVYDNNDTGNVTLTAVQDSTVPNSSGYRMVVTSLAGGEDPGWGGFYVGLPPDGGSFQQNTYHRGSTIIWRIRALIDVGNNINFTSNAYGSGGSFTWLTSQAGTGGYFDYIGKQVIGATGTFSTTGFFYLDGKPPVFNWYVAVCSAVCVSMPQGVGILAVDANRRALIDFAQSHFNKSLDSIPDGTVYGRPVASRLSGGKPWIDFSEGIHANKTLDFLGDGGTYVRMPWGNVDGNRRALIDLSSSGHINSLPVTRLGDGTLNSLISVGAGQIVFDNGSVMRVTGTGFGSSGQFVDWFGPHLASISSCTESNATWYLKTNGDAYFGGALSAGTLTTKAATSDQSSAAVAETATFGSNGGTITVTLSYIFGSGGFGSDGSGSNSCSVDLYRNYAGGGYVKVATLNATGTWAVSGGSGTSTCSGSLTYTDPDNTTSTRQYKAVINTRSCTLLAGTVQQQITVICVE